MRVWVRTALGVLLPCLLMGTFATGQTPEPQLPPTGPPPGAAGAAADPVLPPAPRGYQGEQREMNPHMLGFGLLYTVPEGQPLLDLGKGLHYDYAYNVKPSLQVAVVYTFGGTISIFEGIGGALFFGFPECNFGTTKRSLTVSLRHFPSDRTGWYFGGGTGLGEIKQGVSEGCGVPPGFLSYTALYVPLFAEAGGYWRIPGGAAVFVNAYAGPQLIFGVTDRTAEVTTLKLVSPAVLQRDLRRLTEAHYGIAIGLGFPF